ncbi:MAG: co-chaperone GroES [Candidatus Nanopelagicaceae bacterium]
MAKNTSISKEGFSPVGDRVLIKRVRITESKTQSGIYIPESGTKKKFENLAKVIAVGDGEKISKWIKEGVTVYVADDAPSIVMDEEMGLHVINHDSIVGVL